jgi:hypothetical protein
MGMPANFSQESFFWQNPPPKRSGGGGELTNCDDKKGNYMINESVERRGRVKGKWKRGNYEKGGISGETRASLSSRVMYAF